MKTTCFGL